MSVSMDTAPLVLQGTAIHWLVDMQFTTGTIYVTTAAVDIVAGGNTYLGVGKLANVSVLSESEDGSAEEVLLELTATDQAQLAATLGNVENYRGRKVVIWAQVTNANGMPTGTRVRRWSGYMQPVRVKRNTPDNSVTSVGTIEMPCTRAGLARARNYEGRRVTHQQQIARFPGDLGCEYITSLVNNPVTWLSKRFQQR